jgi:4-amino-4-deoxy-L-arabinose transferase-like glycosyltransferase
MPKPDDDPQAQPDATSNDSAPEAEAPEEPEEASPTSDPDSEPRVENTVAATPVAKSVAKKAHDSAPPGESGAPSWLPLALAAALPLAFFFFLPPLTKSGLWDPYELNVADLARRIALNLFHAGDLALTGTDNSMPHLNDLGRPELPLTSIAYGFKLFGLHEWAGRAPLALWGLAGVLTTYGVVSRLVDKRAALYSVIALTTMPLYFVQARTMLGDIVPMSALAMSFGGLCVALFDTGDPLADEKENSRRFMMRLGWIGIALFGLLAGFYSRGALLGVAVPLGAIGVTYFVTLGAGQRAGDMMSAGLAVVSLLVAIIAIGIVIGAIQANDTKNLSLAIGAMLKPPSKYPTFDYFIGHIGHALAPWSAFVPFAMGRLFIPPIDRPLHEHRRESFFRTAILIGATVVFVAHGFLAAKTDLIAFTGPAILACACGIALRDFERGAHGSIAVGVGTSVFLGVFHHDFHELPEKAYQAFAVTGATFPESYKEHALLLWTLALVGFAGFSFLTWVERDSTRRPFAPASYLAIVNALREAWDGLLALVYFALVAGASLAGLAIWIGVKTKAKWLPTISLQVRDGVLNAWWVTAFVPLVAILGIYFASDVWLWTFGRAKRLSWGSFTRGFEPYEDLVAELKTLDDGPTKLAAWGILVPFMALAVPGAVLFYLVSHHTRLPVAIALAVPSGIAVFLALGLLGDLLRGRRAAGFAFGGAVVGFILCFSYFPALANQLSPKEVFESYEVTHASGEPLGLFGVGGRTAAYYAGGQPASFSETHAAYDWLTAGGEGKRRFLAMRADELARLNQVYREKSGKEGTRQNLPILDARSSQILLVASTLGPNEKNQNPLNKIILSAPPKPQHPLDVNMEDKLQVLGYDLTDQTGKLIDTVAPGRKYRMRTYYRVLAPVTTEWEAFIHIDGYHRRHNGDHKPVDGKYPFNLWLKEDLLVDDYEFSLEPNFSPGSYTIYFGLFVGETRLKVKSGPSDGDNRINGGPLRVQ